MKKRIIAALTAIACIPAALPTHAAVEEVPYNNDFDYYWGYVDLDSPVIAEFLEDFEELDPGHEMSEGRKFYASKLNESVYLITQEICPQLSIKIIDDLTEAEFTAIVKQVDPSYTVYRIKNASDINPDIPKYRDRSYSVHCPMGSENVPAKGKEICRLLSEVTELKKCYYYSASLSYNKGYTEGRDVLEWLYDPNDDSIVEKLTDYVADNAIDAKIETNSWSEITGNDDFKQLSIRIVPNGDMTRQEKYDLARKIVQDTGVRPRIAYPEVACEPIGSTSLEIGTNLDGDANCDGKLTIADAAAVLQNLGNADKYTLTPQGRFNADFDLDGITTADAVKIQKMAVNAE